MLVWAFKASSSQNRIITQLTLSLPEFTGRKGEGGPARPQWGQGDLREVKAVQKGFRPSWRGRRSGSAQLESYARLGQSLFLQRQIRKHRARQEGRERDWDFKGLSPGTCFPQLGSTPKVSTTTPNSATIRRTSIPNKSLWEAFYIQTIR